MERRIVVLAANGRFREGTKMDANTVGSVANATPHFLAGLGYWIQDYWPIIAATLTPWLKGFINDIAAIRDLMTKQNELLTELLKKENGK
jgi:hypothetical protein